MKTNETSSIELVERLKESASLAVNYIKDISPEAFSKDIMRQDTVSKRLENIGETANDLKKLHPEILEKHSNVPWGDIIGLRNRVVHDYQNVDHSMIYDTVKDDLPDLLKTLDNMKYSDEAEQFQISPTNPSAS
jgi:Uncharacterized conserved protein